MKINYFLFLLSLVVFSCSGSEKEENNSGETEENNSAGSAVFDGMIDEIAYMYHYYKDDPTGEQEKMELEMDPALSIAVQSDEFDEEMIDLTGIYYNHKNYLTDKEEINRMLGNFRLDENREGERDDEECETCYRDIFVLYSKQKYVGCIKVSFNCGTYVFVTQNEELLKKTSGKGLFLNLSPEKLKVFLADNKYRRGL